MEDYVKTNFKIAKCCRYVPVDLNQVRKQCVTTKTFQSTDCHCGRSKEWHSKNGINVEDKNKENEQESTPSWSLEKDTVEEECQSFGTIEFEPGMNANRRLFARGAMAKFIRIGANTSDEFMDQVYQLMISHWKMRQPQLIIEVTGAARTLPHVNRDALQAFKHGLVQAAKTSNAWLVTGGTNCGVMELVGDAVSKYNLTHNRKNRLICLGIATWGIVENRDSLVDVNGSKRTYTVDDVAAGESPLDPGHNYFLLVDNGLEKRFGHEIEFRARFTKHLTTKLLNRVQNICSTSHSTTPLVILVIGGGFGTLVTVEKSCGANQGKKEIKRPVVVFNGFGGVGDLLAFCFNKVQSYFEQTSKWSIEDLPEEFDEEVKNHLAFQSLLGGDVNNQEVVEKRIKSIKNCLENPKLVSHFKKV